MLNLGNSNFYPQTADFFLSLCNLSMIFRTEHAAERPSQTAHEGLVCGAVPDGAGAAELLAALPAHADGPAGVGSQWLPDPGEPGPAHPGAVRGQPAAGLPVRSHPARSS